MIDVKAVPVGAKPRRVPVRGGHRTEPVRW